MSFYNKKIPVLHFFTGNHADYHRPSDTWEKLNYRRHGESERSRHGRRAANRRYPGADQFRLACRRARREKRRADERSSSTYLGSIPEYGVNIEGVQLAGVMDGSPAAVAGLRAGDVIIRLASKNIQNIEDLTAALGAQKPGDEVEIIALRAGGRGDFQSYLASPWLKSRQELTIEPEHFRRL